MVAMIQNMESEMIPILEEKLKEFPDRDKYYKKENDMKMLTLIDKKVSQNEELTIEELKFLYETENIIDGFGYKKDPRIEEIKEKRNIKEDLSKTYNVSTEEIAISEEEYKRNPSKYKIY